MDVRSKDMDTVEQVRLMALSLQMDGMARLQGIRSAERAAFRRCKRQILNSERPSRALAAWKKALRCVEASMARSACRNFLPASAGKPCIAHFTEWLWENCETSLTEKKVVALTAAFGQTLSLTYAEIWLIPEALRINALRSFIEDTRILAEFCSDAGDASRERDLRSGNPENEEEREEDCHSALALRFKRAEEILQLLEDMRWQNHISQFSRTEQLLASDPGGVYMRLSEESKQMARMVVQQISARSSVSEEQAVQTAVQICDHSRYSDITQVLLTDEGIERLQDALQTPRRRRFRLHPDPTGKWIIAGSIAFAILLMWLFAALSGRFFITLIGIPVFWKIARLLFNRLMAALVPARQLPRISMEKIPEDMRTLVVVPARIANSEELRERLAELEACASLERDSAVEFLLLADLPEAKLARLPEDDVLMEQSNALVETMNRRQRVRRFHVLWRERSYNERDDIYQPKERKRGALMALYALLGGEASEFLPHSTASRLREGKFRYVITMDAGTMPYPDSLRQLVGMMAWPGNRYAVIQPCMHSALKQCPTMFDKIMFPLAGIGTYPSAAGDLYQDMTGRGIFGGKGIVDVAAFRLALENRLPDNAVLSHDLIEGAFAGTGFAGDVPWFEVQPSTLWGLLARFERWTRGDWQLLPFLLDSRQPLDGLSRFQLADNLLNSLSYVSALLMLAASAWSGSLLAAIVPLACLSMPMLISFSSFDVEWLQRLMSEICLLPAYAWTSFSAICRAVYRTYVSHEHMLDWVPSANAESTAGVSRMPGIVSALLLMPALRHPVMWPAMLALAGLFVIGADWVKVQQMPTEQYALMDDERGFLMELACRTWRFFEKYVTAETNDLPPDNVQTDPPTGAAMRTSPTNIGLYLICCYVASVLGLISREEAEARIGRTLDAMEKLEKWRGHLFNWYDIRTLEPIPPIYVSSVDSGNLAGCLLCLSSMELSEPLKARARSIAEKMELSALYDAEKELFYTGVDAVSGEFTSSHYDLYASESRILSLSAIALGQVPARHWIRLGRPVVRLASGLAHISWSGTMFEYLMPDLLFAAPADSAWRRSAAAVVDLQIDRAIDGMWGVSESGCYEFDEDMNYQYRAFGIEDVGSRADMSAGVIAPYAAALALKYCPHEAVAALRRMAEKGYWDECGMFEAVDFRDGESHCVASHMAHHQGMLFCAIANALTDGILWRSTMQLPEFRALEPLFQEKLQM